MAETRRYGESERLHRSTLDARERVLGVEDPDTLSSCQVLAIVLDKPGRYEEARACFERAYEGRRKVLGPDHRDTLDSANGLAVIDMMNGRYDSAESIFRATIKTQREKYGLDHAKTKWTANNLAGLLMIYDLRAGRGSARIGGGDRIELTEVKTGRGSTSHCEDFASFLILSNAIVTCDL